MNVLITGATDGIGLATAKMLAAQGHSLLLHGRSADKLTAAAQLLSTDTNSIACYRADLSNLSEVKKLAAEIAAQHSQLDVLINNAGVFKVTPALNKDGLDVRFVVNTLAPYLLTQQLMPLLFSSSRIINISSAAQAPVNIKALLGEVAIADDFEAYAQSKLAITAWTQAWGESFDEQQPSIVSVNPGSMLGSKMVSEGFGVAGGDINIGAEILCRLALEDEFKRMSGEYFDNDAGKLSKPHSDISNHAKTEQLIQAIESILNR